MVETIYRIPDAPRLALLADLHGQDYRLAVNSLKQHQPEIIAVAGDILSRFYLMEDKSPLDTQKRIMPFLCASAAIAPTYLSLGNHEHILDGADLKRIKETGVVVLDNSWIKCGKLVIGGLTSGFCLSYRAFKEFVDFGPDTSWLAEFAAVPGFHILLSHHPEYYPLIPEGIELILSGHAHGGQWRFLGKGVSAPGQGLFPKYTKGVYGRRVVSTGLANTARIPRLFNPTEIVYIN